MKLRHLLLLPVYAVGAVVGVYRAVREHDAARQSFIRIMTPSAHAVALAEVLPYSAAQIDQMSEPELRQIIQRYGAA